jgi:hypothetical protein
MLIHPMVERLRGLGLAAMADAFMEMQRNSTADDLSREDWLGLLIDREATAREGKRLTRRLRQARLRQNAVIEDTDLRTPRGLDRGLFQKLATCGWIRESQHLLIGGPTGVGKSWLACALGHKACRDGLPPPRRQSRRWSPAFVEPKASKPAALLRSNAYPAIELQGESRRNSERDWQPRYSLAVYQRGSPTLAEILQLWKTRQGPHALGTIERNGSRFSGRCGALIAADTTQGAGCGSKFRLGVHIRPGPEPNRRTLTTSAGKLLSQPTGQYERTCFAEQIRSATDDCKITGR